VNVNVLGLMTTCWEKSWSVTEVVGGVRVRMVKTLDGLSYTSSSLPELYVGIVISNVAFLERIVTEETGSYQAASVPVTTNDTTEVMAAAVGVAVNVTEVDPAVNTMGLTCTLAAAEGVIVRSAVEA